MISFLESSGFKASIVSSTGLPAGSIMTTTLGERSLSTASFREYAPTTLSASAFFVLSAVLLYPTTLCPPLASLLAMLSPIRPRPIIPTSITPPYRLRCGRAQEELFERPQRFDGRVLQVDQRDPQALCVKGLHV